MTKVCIIGLDLAKNTIQAHGADGGGAVKFRRNKMARSKLLEFLAGFVPCVVAMEACAGAHHWGRAIMRLRHEVRLIAPSYVKPFVKRQKNDAADAEAICEAAMRPTMIFVAVKSEAKQASAVVFKARDLLVRQRTQIINALRGHMAEFGVIVPQGPSHVEYLLGTHRKSGLGLAGSGAWFLPGIGGDAAFAGRANRRSGSRSHPARGRTKPPRG